MKTLVEEYKKIKKEREEVELKFNNSLSKYAELCRTYGNLGRVDYNFDMDGRILNIEKAEEDWTNCHRISISSKLGFVIRTEFNPSFHRSITFKSGIVFCDEIVKLGNAISELDDKLLDEFGRFSIEEEE